MGNNYQNTKTTQNGTNLCKIILEPYEACSSKTCAKICLKVYKSNQMQKIPVVPVLRKKIGGKQASTAPEINTFGTQWPMSWCLKKPHTICLILKMKTINPILETTKM